VARYGIGVDTINVADATDHGIMVTNVPDYCVNEVADHAVALFLTLARKTAFSDRKIREGEWSLSYVKPMKAIQGMTVGIVGFGRIGREIAQRVLTFGAQVVFTDPFVSEPLAGTAPVDLDTLLESSDAVFIQCPSTEETYHLLDRSAFERMKARPFLINTARGPIVDTDAVVWALKNDRIAGAALDVLENEEAVVKHDHALKTFDNVILTPHSAWFSDRAIPQLQRLAAEEVARALRGERPRSLINPEVWKG
jgi:D-3-phosphoglycerate dehydrogenase